jgi:hypothetical protein
VEEGAERDRGDYGDGERGELDGRRGHGGGGGARMELGGIAGTIERYVSGGGRHAKWRACGRCMFRDGFG